MLAIEEALRRVLSLAGKTLEAEWVTIDKALGRVLANPVESSRALPPFDNSAMDGYALCYEDAHQGARLEVVGEIPAGSVFSGDFQRGQALRIFTGAPIPEQVDTVIMQEDTKREGSVVVLTGTKFKEGQHIRRRGGDVEVGDEVLRAGTCLTPGEIGLLAACGRSGVLVHRRPRVAIISTGHELLYVDEQPGPGQIVNSNGLALMAQVRSAGGDPSHFAIVPDTKEAHHEAFERAERYDLVLTSGGVSVGDHDLIQPVLEERGWTRDFWKVAMKPGKPVLCGTLPSGTIFLGLPGNPASTMVSFELFGRPLIRALQNHPWPFRAIDHKPLAADYPKKSGRSHVVRGEIHEGAFVPRSRQGSGMLRSMVGVTSFAFMRSEGTLIEKGEKVLIWDLRHEGTDIWPFPEGSL